MNSLSAKMVVIAAGCMALGQNAPPAKPPAAPQSPPAVPTQPAAPSAPTDKLDRVAEIIAERLPQLHGSAVWRQKSAVQADLAIEIGGQPILDGTLIYETNRRRARINLANGGHIMFDGQTVHVVSSTMPVDQAKAHLELWPRLLATPFQLRDRGVQASQFRSVYLRGVNYDHIRLTTKTPDGKDTGEWRAVFSDVKNHMVRGVGNVPLQPFVKDAAANDQFVVMLDDYTEVDGVKFATKWTFWKWNDDLVGEALGVAKLSNLKFVVPADDAFETQSPSSPRKAKAGETAPDQPK
jgi:hypothetical protein